MEIRKFLCVFTLLTLLSGVVFGADKITYPDFFPEYSWDKVSVYAHTSDANDFTDEQYRVLAKYPIVCVSGSMGKKKYGSLDKGVVAVGEKLKALNPDIKLLCYLSFQTDYSNGYSTGRVITDDKNQHWALKDKNGKSMTTSRTNLHFDKSHKEVRDYMVSLLDEWTSKPYLDGVFFDSYTTISKKREAALAVKLGAKKAKDFLEGEDIVRQQVKEKISSKKIVIGNGVSAKAGEDKDDMEWLETVSGGMMDHFGFNSAKKDKDLAAAIEHISEVGKAGKMIMVKAWPEIHHKTKGYNKKEVDKLMESAKNSITFPLACFLCGAQKYAYFCYSWAWSVEAGAAYEFEEFDKPLGEPKGDYKRKGWEFSREFAHASVWVNVQTQQAKINWK